MATRSLLAVSESAGISECLDRLAAGKGSTRPIATYRLQFNHQFRFDDGRRLVSYLHQLGISHCYASPLLKARQGSMHGYDITDHNAFNPEIGAEDEFHRMVAELKGHGMGLILDIVPNHMGVGQGDNPWWQDVLENGRSSEYASFFDIDWEPLKTDMRDKLLLPILGAQYGDELEQGHVKVAYQDGRFLAQYYDRRLPLDPQTYPLIFEVFGHLRARYQDQRWVETGMAELESLLNALRNLPKHDAEDKYERRRVIPELQQRLAALMDTAPEVRVVTGEALGRINGEPGNRRSFDALHHLLDAQAYRLAHWRVSAEEINYRRFFDINELVGLRMEDPRVFAATHRLIRRLLAEGSIAGLRVDHPDGMYNPPQFFTRLQMLYAASQCCGPEPVPPLAENGIEAEVQNIFSQYGWVNRAPLYVLVEKILERGESLPRDWPIDGTVGYDYANLMNGIFIDQRSARDFTRIYQRFVGGHVDPDELIYQSKKLILNTALSSELTVLSHMLEELSSADRRARDFTRKTLTDAARETIACFPVYRTYIDERGNLIARDREYINEAITRAKRRNEVIAAPVFDFLRDILLLRSDESFANSDAHRVRLLFTLKFQQLTGPAMAKGLEDTACYAYNRFVSVNEVGGTPKEFGLPVDEFHRGNMIRQECWPFSMLATSTHDTKRSEDVRARLNVLSEMPRLWATQVMRWRRANRSKKRLLADGRTVPDLNEEYLLYQTLAGTWPFRMETPQQRDDYVRRIQQYMNKAVHEAKVNLSWVNDNPEYIAALEQFVARILAKQGKNAFLEHIEAFLPPIQLFGAMNSLSQTLLKFTAPGVPDIYQGMELFDFSLVDPDNRRPVDFSLRCRWLEEMHGRANDPDLVPWLAELLETYQDGRIKLWTTMRALRFRREHAELFQHGSYTPLYGAVEKQEHLVAFARTHKTEMAVTATPRFAYTMMGMERAFPMGEAWRNAELALPPRAPAEFLNVLTGEIVKTTASRSLLCRELFAHFPLALLTSY